jgi:pentatricopeptide repeat protein
MKCLSGGEVTQNVSIMLWHHWSQLQNRRLVSYSGSIDGLGKAGEVGLACGLLNRMKKKNVVPHLEHGSAGRLFGGFTVLSNRWEMRVIWIPDFLTNNPVIYILGNQGSWIGSSLSPRKLIIVRKLFSIYLGIG